MANDDADIVLHILAIKESQPSFLSVSNTNPCEESIL